MAVAAAFRSDPSIRYDWKHLANCLTRFERLRLAFMTIRELGFPPTWLGDKAFSLPYCGLAPIEFDGFPRGQIFWLECLRLMCSTRALPNSSKGRGGKGAIKSGASCRRRRWPWSAL